MPERGNDFATFLMDLAHGEVNRELSERLEAVVKSVNETNKSGSLTIKISIVKEGTMAVTKVDCKTKLPEEDMPGTMFFFSMDGHTLTREDERQLTLRELATPSQPPRIVGDGEGGDR